MREIYSPMDETARNLYRLILPGCYAGGESAADFVPSCDLTDTTVARAVGPSSQYIISPPSSGHSKRMDRERYGVACVTFDCRR